MRHKRIVLTGGGSGGHVFPLIAVAEELQRQYDDVDFLYIGTKSQMGDVAEKAMHEIGVPTKNIFTGKMRRYFSMQYFLDCFRIPAGIIQALYHLLVYMPDAVFSKGGYASVPVVIAAWIYRIPIMTHDSDAVPGWANRIGGKLSRYVAISYPSSEKYFLARKTVLTGNPLRTTILQGDYTRGYQRWGFSDNRPTLLIVGGSQGAKVINDALLKILPQLSKMVQILHITGKNNYQQAKQLAARAGFKSGRHRYYAVPFLDREEMADAYAVADIVVSRAGANSISEIAATKNVAIFIPLVNKDQRMNAFEIAKIGGGLVMEERNLGGNLLLEKIEQLLTEKELRTQIQNNIAEFYHPDAAQKIAAGIVKMIEEKEK